MSGAVLAALHDLHRDREVRRAWPGADGTLTLETRDADGTLRAGRLGPDGLTLAPAGVDRKLPALTGAAPGGDLLVHRLHKRAVLRHGHRFTKVVRPGRAEPIRVASEAVGDACAAAGIAAAPVLAGTDDTVVFGALAGRTLHDLGADGLPGWEALARAWPAFVAGAAPVGAHDAAREAATLTGWLDHLDRFDALPSHRAALRAAGERVAADLAAGRPEAAGLLHRDLHDKQVLWDAATGTLGLLDLDTAAVGEPALDLANLAAHVDLRVLQGVLPAATAAEVHGLLSWVADAVGASPARLEAYGRSARLRLACVYAFRPGAAVWLDSWVEEALSGA